MIKTELETQIKTVWHEPQLVTTQDGLIVLSIGENSDEHFTGTVLVNDVKSSYNIGHHSSKWIKSHFTALTTKITLQNG